MSLACHFAFARSYVGGGSKTGSQNFLNYKSLARAVEIRGQLVKFLRRFRIPLVSCDGDVDAVYYFFAFLGNHFRHFRPYFTYFTPLCVLFTIARARPKLIWALHPDGIA